MTFVELYTAPNDMEARRCISFMDNADADCLLDNLIGYDENQTGPVVDEADLVGILEEVDDDYFFLYSDHGYSMFTLLRRLT